MGKKIFIASIISLIAILTFATPSFARPANQFEEDENNNSNSGNNQAPSNYNPNNTNVNEQVPEYVNMTCQALINLGRDGECKDEHNRECYQRGSIRACKGIDYINNQYPRDVCYVPEEKVNEIANAPTTNPLKRFCQALPVLPDPEQTAPDTTNTPTEEPSNGNGGGGGNNNGGGSYQGNIPITPEGNDNNYNGNNPESHESTFTEESSPAVFSGDCRYVLGFISWDCTVNISGGNSLKSDVWQIALNVLANISVIAAYLVLGYIIYGGYLYTMSGGSADKILAGKKTLTRAFTGLAIVVLANAIMNTIRFVLIGANGNFLNCVTSEGCVNPTSMITNTIHWTIAIASIVAVIFVIYGGVSLMTSSGDPGKVKKAKDMILYSTIGLIVTALAEIITAFVSNIINNAS